jgi:hypothetical protein
VVVDDIQQWAYEIGSRLESFGHHDEATFDLIDDIFGFKDDPKYAQYSQENFAHAFDLSKRLNMVIQSLNAQTERSAERTRRSVMCIYRLADSTGRCFPLSTAALVTEKLTLVRPSQRSERLDKNTRDQDREAKNDTGWQGPRRHTVRFELRIESGIISDSHSSNQASRE